MLPCVKVECKTQGLGFRAQGAGCRVQGAGCRLQGAGCRLQGAGCRVQVVGCRVQGAGCRVQGAGCRVQGHAGCAGRRGGQVPHAGHHRHQGLISHKVFVTYLTQIVFKLFPLHSEEDYLAQRVFQSRFAKANSHANPSTYFLTPTLISHQVFFKIVRRSQFPQKSVNLFLILMIAKDNLTDLWGS